LGEFGGDFSWSLGDFFTKTSGHPAPAEPPPAFFISQLPEWFSTEEPNIRKKTM
jgi:hypothetical protein